MNIKHPGRALQIVLIAASVLLSIAFSHAQTKSPELCVMTYNLRFANNNPGEVWATRRPIMVELIKKISPDVFGTQEGVYLQIKNLATDLPDYDWIGLGRDGGSKGEF